MRAFVGIRGAKSLYLYSILIGIFSGIGAYLFAYGLSNAEYIIQTVWMGWDKAHPAGEPAIGHATGIFRREYLLFLPAIGGLLTGCITYFLCRDAQGTGTDAMINAFHYNEGKISGKVPFYKAITTIITLTSGGSAGKEGPTAQIGAGIGSSIGKLLGVGARARRTLLLAGTAGGLGAIFRAPFGGALTAVEVVYKEDIESDSLVPCIISSVSAYLVFTGIAGSGSVFHVVGVGLKSYHDLIYYFLLGILCYGVGFIFVKIFNLVENFFVKMQLHPILKPALGGVIIGPVVYLIPDLTGTGFGLLQEIIDGKPVTDWDSNSAMAGFFLTIAFLKIITTSFTIGSGGSGGVFGPSLFIGGMLGGFVGCIARIISPESNFDIASFVLVGMGAFFAGVAKAPIAGMVMVCDMIGSYALLPPLMIVSVITGVLSNRFSIYKGQVANRFHSPSHHWDMNQDIMERIEISKMFKEFRKIAIVQESTLLRDLEKSSSKIQASDYIITNSTKKYVGSVSLRKHRLSVEYDHLIDQLITVADLAEQVPSVSPNQTLGQALKIIVDYDIDKVAVVDSNSILLGYLRYIDLFKAYHEEIKNHSRISSKIG
ncbi:chloride channel protein [Leptospira sp. GIMC2001]|nr:chloride channel protein [Leptospira sp. GIMC2001]WCL50077.1 chloride channel protein [Leptospira sp. GIMC2001]